MANPKTSAMSKEVKLVKVAKPLTETDEKSAITNKKTSRTSSPHFVLKRSIDVVQGRVVTDQAARAVSFVGKVVVLEGLRRVGHTNFYGVHRPLVLQGPAGLNPKRSNDHFLVAAQLRGFANPIILLSLAGVVTSAYKHKDSLNPDSRHPDARPKDLSQETVVTVPKTVPAVNVAISYPRAVEVKEESILTSEGPETNAAFLKEEMDKSGVILPEW